MLARLDAIDGVAAARTDSSGRFFWIGMAPGADADQVVDRVREVLGSGARRLPPDQAAAQLAAHGRGDPWLREGEVMALSFVEGRLLSVRLAGEACRQVGAGAELREAVAEAIRVELFAALERVHREGGRRSSAWIYREWPEIAAAACARCAPAISTDLAAGLAGVLPRLLAP